MTRCAHVARRLVFYRSYEKRSASFGTHRTTPAALTGRWRRLDERTQSAKITRHSGIADILTGPIEQDAIHKVPKVRRHIHVLKCGGTGRVPLLIRDGIRNGRYFFPENFGSL